jgi:UDP-glucose 4-epimerase
MRVLITGGAGFIGYHLSLFHVQRGDEVYVFDNLYKQKNAIDEDLQILFSFKNIFYAQVDLTKPLDVGLFSDVKEFDVVYHLAAINGTELFYKIPYEVCRSNSLMTLHLLDWLEHKKITRLLYTSTSEVYAGASAYGLLDIPTDENVPVVFPQPTDVRFSYATGKFLGEFLCLEYGKKEGVLTTVVRYHNVYGPRMGMRHVIPEFIRRLYSKENPFELYGADETRSFCYVQDAVVATAKLVSLKECAYSTVHIGNSSCEVSVQFLLKRVMEHMSFSPSVKHVLSERTSSVQRRCPSTERLKEMTGYVCDTSLEEGLRATVDWYLRFLGKQM